LMNWMSQFHFCDTLFPIVGGWRYQMKIALFFQSEFPVRRKITGKHAIMRFRKDGGHISTKYNK